ncbi:hypothetical protein AVEN_108983-1 [Araneus ventricosus]|uniref:Uncharacterized protein n=1 Tax=Araneus ventricosus TaxID=182803 RepID=A0A4Y2F6W0_ARAVE|nr:hypothetical protein AVEN_108983-1 [Araneus ventricosus]
MMNNVDVSFALDIPTYSCPCEKHSSVKSKPVTRSDRPCALMIVIANASRRGNCNRWKENGRQVSRNEWYPWNSDALALKWPS